eukprot:9892671-Prorocentrum_lima.AAC.1
MTSGSTFLQEAMSANQGLKLSSRDPCIGINANEAGVAPNECRERGPRDGGLVAAFAHPLILEH